MMSDITAIHTSCKNCVFAKYDGITQTDCYLEYIQTFKDNNVSVVEAYDEEKEFYIINNKKCIGYRDKDWILKNNLDINNIQSIIDAFNKTNQINYISIIDTKNLSINNIKDILQKLKIQSHKPQKIFLIRYSTNQDLSFSKIKPILEDTNIPWKIQTSLDTNTPIEYFIGTILNTQRTRFVLLINNYSTDIDKIIETSYDRVYKELKQILVLRNKDNSCLMFSSSVYKFSKIEGIDLFNDNQYHAML